MNKTLIDLRRNLHKNPEISGQEKNTAGLIKTFASQYNPSKIIEQLGGHGLAIIYTFDEIGPTFMLRCELDALPIQELNSFDYKSSIQGISHKCGHDGHMTILCSLMPWLANQPNLSGKVILLFQPSEENGEGGKAVINDKKFNSIKPDYIMAIHNLPGVKLGKVILAPGTTTPTVQSFSISLIGKESHASEPQKGVNPAIAISSIISKLSLWSNQDMSSDSFALLTPIFINMGKKAYGISAGQGEIHYTMRTWSEKKMESLKQKIMTYLSSICSEMKLKYKINWFDYFPSTQNNAQLGKIVKKVAKESALKFKRSSPFSFGEDFGWYSKQIPSCYIGLGAGKKVPPLHNELYDFPNELIQIGHALFKNMIKHMNQSKHD